MRGWLSREGIIYCRCGLEMDEDDDYYNADTGHYKCPNCGSESPDLENIEIDGY